VAVLLWNDKELEVSGDKIYTFSGWSATSSYKTEEKENGKKMPKSKALSPGMGSISFDVTLSWQMGVDVKDEYEWWRTQCNEGTQSLLYLGEQQFGAYKWRLTGVNQTGLITLKDGTWKQCKMNLSFEESWYKVRLTRLERKAKRLAKRLARQTKKVENAKTEAAKEKAAAKAAKTKKEAEEAAAAAAKEKADKWKAGRAAKQDAADRINKYYSKL